MLSFRNLVVILVVWTAASPVWPVDGSDRTDPNNLGTDPNYLPTDPNYLRTGHTAVQYSTPGASSQSSQTNPVDERDNTDPNARSPGRELRRSPSLVSSPSPPGASPLPHHPGGNVRAPASGQDQAPSACSRQHYDDLPSLPGQAGVTPWSRLSELVEAKTPLLGQYRLTDEQIRILLSIARVIFAQHADYPTEETKATIPYAVGVVNDLICQPNFAAIMKAIYATGGRILHETPVCAYLMYRQADLATKMILAARRPITEDEFGCAMTSASLEVVDKLCKFAEAHPELVALDNSIVRMYVSWIDTEKHTVPNFRPVVSEKDFLAARQQCLNAVKLKQER